MARTEAQARGDYARFWPGRNWNQSCQAAVAWLAKYTTGRVEFYLSAADAFEASQIVSRKSAKARLNDVHYWRIGTDEHTAVQLAKGVLMASAHTDQSWGTNLGVTTVEAYSRATGAVYLGFARSNGVNQVLISPPRKGGSAQVRLNAAYLNSLGLYPKKTTAEQDGSVDQTGRVEQIYWRLEQIWGRQRGMYGAAFRIDGKVGTQTRKIDKAVTKAAKAWAAKR